MAKPVVIVESGGLPVVNVAGALPMSPVASGGMPVTRVESLGKPVSLLNADNSLFSLNRTSYITFAFASGVATVTPPTHLAPVGTQKDMLLGFAINPSSTTVPTFDNTVGWTQLTLPADGAGAGVGTTTASIAFVKYCATASEAFGTHTNASRVLCTHWRLTNAPADVLDAIGAIGFDNKGGSTPTNVWVELTLENALSNVFTLMLARINQDIAHRTDTISKDQQTGGVNRVAMGRSNGLVSSWERQVVTPAGSPVNTETLSIAVEVVS